MRLLRSMDLNKIARKATKAVAAKAKLLHPAIAWSMHFGAVDINPKHLAIW